MALNGSQRRENTDKVVEAIRQKIGERIEDIADQILREATKIIAEEATSTGELLRSGHVIRRGQTKATVRFDAPHAAPVHNGVDPGTFPPVDALKPWVRRTLSPDDKSVETVAFLVARKIYQEGTMPVRYLARAKRRIENKLG